MSGYCWECDDTLGGMSESGVRSRRYDAKFCSVECKNRYHGKRRKKTSIMNQIKKYREKLFILNREMHYTREDLELAKFLKGYVDDVIAHYEEIDAGSGVLDGQLDLPF